MRTTRTATAPETFLHSRYGILTFRGQAWVGHKGTCYGAFTDSTGQQVNLPLGEVSLDLLVRLLPIFDEV